MYLEVSLSEMKRIAKYQIISFLSFGNPTNWYKFIYSLKNQVENTIMRSFPNLFQYIPIFLLEK